MSQFAEYLPHIRQRWLAEQAGWAQRREQALQTARRIAEVLRADYGAARVLLFGSAVHSGPFDAASDIDIAVDGLPSALFFQAVVRAMALSPTLRVDVVDLADCPPALRTVILTEGVEL